MEIRLAQITDLTAYYEHLTRHSKESGTDGEIIFAPFEEAWEGTEEEIRAEKEESWNKTTQEPGWERAWILVDGARICGELKLLHRPAIKSTLHRAVLMMGIEKADRGQGWGSRLLKESIDWAKTQTHLEWLQLHVFEHNEPAKRLYEKFGFVETGATLDNFRVNGQKITDIQMVLKLGT